MTPALPGFFRLVEFERIDSTNDEARRSIQAGAGHGTVIWARQQTAGRGRRGRHWSSPDGNLFCSVVLDCCADRTKAAQLTFVAAIALWDSVAALLPTSALQLKWPNDLLCSGQKLAGMLLEWEESLAILGVGVNVVALPDLPLLYPATSLARQGSGASVADILTGFCTSLAIWYERWQSDGFSPIRDAWLSRAGGVGAVVTARFADHSEQTGRFVGLDEDGALMLAEEGGEVRRILAGDIFF